MNGLKEQEVNRVKRALLSDAALLRSLILHLEREGDALNDIMSYRKGAYNQTCSLLYVLYDVDSNKLEDLMSRAVKGLGKIDYDLIFFEMGIK